MDVELCGWMFLHGGHPQAPAHTAPATCGRGGPPAGLCDGTTGQTSDDDDDGQGRRQKHESSSPKKRSQLQPRPASYSAERGGGAGSIAAPWPAPWLSGSQPVLYRASAAANRGLVSTHPRIQPAVISLRVSVSQCAKIPIQPSGAKAPAPSWNRRVERGGKLYLPAAAGDVVAWAPQARVLCSCGLLRTPYEYLPTSTGTRARLEQIFTPPSARRGAPGIALHCFDPSSLHLLRPTLGSAVLAVQLSRTDPGRTRPLRTADELLRPALEGTCTRIPYPR